MVEVVEATKSLTREATNLTSNSITKVELVTSPSIPTTTVDMVLLKPITQPPKPTIILAHNMALELKLKSTLPTKREVVAVATIEVEALTVVVEEMTSMTPAIRATEAADAISTLSHLHLNRKDIKLPNIRSLKRMRKRMSKK